MKRRSAHIRWRTKLAVLLSLSFCIGTLVLIQKQQSRIMRLTDSTSPPPYQKPKISFLFIARNRLPLDVIWDAFFQGHAGTFSIYVHSRPSFLFNQATTKSKYFYGRQVNNSIQVDWGEASMLQAERILLSNSLKDATNERFIFLSESCIPLYNFSYIYDYIMSTPTSFVDSFADTKEGRYNPKMYPVIPMHNWRKGSQWAVLIRKHAEIMVNDDMVFPEFQKHCRRRSLPEFWRDRLFRERKRRRRRRAPATASCHRRRHSKHDHRRVELRRVEDHMRGELHGEDCGTERIARVEKSQHLGLNRAGSGFYHLRARLLWFQGKQNNWLRMTFRFLKITFLVQPADVSKEHNCIPDEHYVQTLIAHKGLEDEITRRPLTHSLWDHSSSKDRERGGWHPVTYKLSDATPKLVKTIQDIDNIYYETEYRREWCSSKGKPSRCFLFARKFTRASALKLLDTGALAIN